MKNKIVMQSLTEQTRALRAGEYSSVELTRAYLDEIGKREPEVGAYLCVDDEGALRAAAASDARRRAGELLGPLDGIPYAAKDNFCTKGLPTTCASRMLKDFVPPYDATVISRLKSAGAILLGKLNMDEFAMGSTGKLSAFGETRNPRDPAFITGGSSSGTAAAVAAREACFALGSDTGGSIRQPAAFCGVLGLKPTYGVLSRYGLVSMASSLDCAGIVTQTASDAALVMHALVGKDPMDATSRTHPDPDFSKLSALPPLRVAVVRELIEGDTVVPAVAEACRRAIARLAEHGAIIEEVSLPSPDRALAAYCVLSAAEAASNMARYDGIRFGTRVSQSDDLTAFYAENRANGFGEEVKRRILFGSYMLTREKRAAYYDAARAARAEIREYMNELLTKYDLIVNPTSPTGALRRGEQIPPDQQRRADLCAVYANLAGLPAVSVPYGRDAGGMPLAVHLTAARFQERLLLEAAMLLEEVQV